MNSEHQLLRIRTWGIDGVLQQLVFNSTLEQRGTFEGAKSLNQTRVALCGNKYAEVPFYV